MFAITLNGLIETTHCNRSATSKRRPFCKPLSAIARSPVRFDQSTMTGI
jgi:hypothetical protein